VKKPHIEQEYVGKLYNAIRESRNALKPFREKRYEAMKQFVGSHYGDQVGMEQGKTPTNFLEMAVMIYVRALAASVPQAMITANGKSLRVVAQKLELGLNHLLRNRLRLETEFQAAVMEAIFSIGIMKVGINVSETVRMGNYLHDIGQPFAESVTLDDWVWDMQAKKHPHCNFMGHRFRCSLDELKESDLYDKKRIEQMSRDMNLRVNVEGDQRPQQMSSGGRLSVSESELEEMVELWEIWVPRKNLILTLDVIGEGEPLRVVEWDGPKDGPYHFLSFQPVPDNIMPLPPVAIWRDLHDLGNRIFRKLARQGERQKTILAFQRGNDDDAQRIKDSGDGDVVPMDNPGSAQELNFGGPNQMNLGIFLAIKDLFNMFGGNLEVLGGLSPQADTLGQEELIAASASKRVATMQSSTIEFARKTIVDLAWWLWTDPYIELPFVYRVPGTEQEFDLSFTARDRQGEFLEYNFSINPYSMAERSPAQQVQSFMGLWQNIILPAMPMMEQQGIQLNMEGVLRFMGNKLGIDGLDELIEFGESVGEADSPVVPPGVQKPAFTKRTYERVNRPGRTRRGSDFALMQTALGGGVQPREQENFARGGGNY